MFYLFDRYFKLRIDSLPGAGTRDPTHDKVMRERT